MALLEVSGLHTDFDTREGLLRAVDGVSFDLDEGETIGLVGESGCGKSVTALSLMRLIAPPGRIVGGEVVFDGHDMLQLPEEDVRKIRGKSMAMIFQDAGTSLNPGLTVGRQIIEALELHLGLKRTMAHSRTIELLRNVGIPDAEERMKDYPHQFSGGMRQRAMIAMALSCNPKLVLLDEITTALDMTIQAQILELIRALARDSRAAFLLITHDLAIVAGMAQRVHVMYAGKVVEQADTRDLFSNPRMPYTWGLLRSIPRLDQPRKEKLVPIEGLPPDLVSPPRGCRFEPRCRYRRAICSEREPDLLPVPDVKNPLTRCWATQRVPGGGWLADVPWRLADVVQEQIDSQQPQSASKPPGSIRPLAEGPA